MSYEIIYDKQFIKLEQPNKPTQFIPMILCGSNNCTESYYTSNGHLRERRERGWHNFSWLNEGAFWGTQETMLKKMEQTRAEYMNQSEESKELHGKYRDDSFGYWASIAIGGSTRNTSYRNYKGIVVNGCKNAMTIEELEANGISLKLFTGSDYYNKDKFKTAGIEPFTLYPTTTKEFFEMIEEFKAKTEPYGIPCYFQLTANQKTLKRLRKTLNPKKKVRQLVEVEKWWSIDIENLGTFAKFTRNSTRYSPYSDGGKQYADFATAKRACKKVQEKLGIRYGKISLVEHNTPTKIWMTSYVSKKEEA